MLNGFNREESRHAVYDLAEAAAAVMGEASIVHAAAVRAIETRARADAERFLRHLEHAKEADRIRIFRRRDTILFERWTRAAFGTAGLREKER